jgi:long-chain acyl-CoA synthetase
VNLCDTLRAHAAEQPQSAALLCGTRALSYRELDESSTALAQWLLSQGLKPGDRVALHWSNSIEVVQLFFAAFKAGLVAVTVNTRLKPAEIGYILKHSQARICFSEPTLAGLAEQSGAGCLIRTALPPSPPTDARWAASTVLDLDKPALILYTSGTTAQPKGVTHSHRSLFSTAAMLAQEEMVQADDIALAVTQLMHAAALNIVLLPSLYLGASVVLLPAFDPGAFLDAVEQFRGTFVFCLPAQWQFVTEEQARKPREVSSLRTIFVGGDSVSLALQTRSRETFGLEVQELYGMTESVPTTYNRKGSVRPGSIGRPPEGCELRIVDLSGLHVAAGGTGEIVVRSATNCIGYWNDPDSTRAAIDPEGWLRTGDLGSRDPEGYYWFKGRLKQIIVRGGSNISPQEVEGALYQHPAVLEAGVVGASDATYGEVVLAFVALRNGKTVDEAELRAFAGQRLADYKLPERIVFLESLPKGLTGKVNRRALKEMLSTAAGA